MPRIVNYTPPWLSRPSPGSKIFTDPPAAVSPVSPSKRASQLGVPSGDKSSENYEGPRRLLARRGTEIFTVVGNKLRWADLCTLKDDWEEHSSAWKKQSTTATSSKEDKSTDGVPYRVLAVPVYQQIRQLIISPSEVFLAILTEHTVHIAVLPDSSRLRDQDRSPLKLKTYQLGPTTHVIPQSPVVCALWHPLAVSGNSTDCLVTVTSEAAVRIWELDRTNHWSFDRPALAIDLKKLIDGTSCDEDFEPSGFGKSRGFSADVFEMEATSACFGGQGLEEEDGWASMTLWCSMRNGDVYALCPLLPSKWRPSSTIIPSLSTDVVARMSSIDDQELDETEKRALLQQYEWVQEIDAEAPTLETPSKSSRSGEIRHRPSNPSAIPRLQGPFEIDLENDDEDFEVSNIHVIAAKLDTEELVTDDEDEFYDLAVATKDSLSSTIICLATTAGKAYLMLDMEGISGQWLPKTGRSTFSVPMSDARELLLIETVDTRLSPGGEGSFCWPVFSPDAVSRYNLFLTTPYQITFVSLIDWASHLEAEMSSHITDQTGLALRLKGVCEENVALIEEILNETGKESGIENGPLSAPLVFRDPNLGYMLLCSTPQRAYAASFDQPDMLVEEFSQSPFQAKSPSPLPPNMAFIQDSSTPGFENRPSRYPYVPHPMFYNQPTAPLKHFLTMNVPQRQKLTLKQEIRLSPATLELMNSAHRSISAQASQLEIAAADLFRRCEILREELGNQVKQMSELSARMQRISVITEEDGSEEKTFDQRLEDVKARQLKLSERHEALRRKMARAGAGGRELSTKELGWIHEINNLSYAVGVDAETETEDVKIVSKNSLEGRFDMVKQLAEELLVQSKNLKTQSKNGGDGKQSNGLDKSTSNASHRLSLSSSSLLVPSKLQKAKIAEAMTMVEREGAVIEAVMARLEKLNVEY